MQIQGIFTYLVSKFEWLIHYLFLVFNDFVFLNPLKCQFCTICDIFLAFNMKNDNKISFKWPRILFTKQMQGICTYPRSLNDYFTTFCILYLIILVLNPLKKLILTVQLQASIKKNRPNRKFSFFCFLSDNIQYSEKMQELDLRIFDKYLFASRWGVSSLHHSIINWVAIFIFVIHFTQSKSITR